MSNFEIIQGDALEVLRTLPAESVDSMVTDPPAGISFMSKEWDHDHGGRAEWCAGFGAIFAESLRVLKPGAHALVWAIPRTSHWTATALEDAGFEIRDIVMHLFGTGFPKSLDVSKAIDKCNGETGRAYKFTAWMRTAGLTAAKINEITGTFMGGHFLTDKSQAEVPTRELFEKMRPHLGDVPDWIDRLVERVEAEREVVGAETKARSTSGKSALPTCGGETVYETWDITAPATEAARQWEGWGTALKPAAEHWILCRKPLIGTVAANVIAHGCGAINVDGCRIGHDEPEKRTTRTVGKFSGNAYAEDDYSVKMNGGTLASPSASGRWPANVVLSHAEGCELVGEKRVENQGGVPGAVRRDTSDPTFTSRKYVGQAHHFDADGLETVEDWRCVDECAVRQLDEQSGDTSSARLSGNPNNPHRGKNHRATSYGQGDGTVTHDYRDAGTASRFFYCAKPSTAERNIGQTDNRHPTVKAAELMAYLCRLITPPGGIVLDPFVGSGSTGIAALREGFSFIGIEREEEYVELARQRIKGDAPLFNRER